MKYFFLLCLGSLLFSSAWSQPFLRLGINFPMRNPEAAGIAAYMNLVSESKSQIARQLTFGDVLWHQVEPGDNQWNFVYADSVFLGFTGINYVGTLYSMFLQDTIGYQVPWKACSNPGNPACRWIASRDSNDTKQYLDTLIKRYGNVIHYWELGNEVENHGYPRGFPLPQLVQFFSHNYRWIKSGDADAKVIIPSFIGTYGVPMQSKYDWLRSFFTLGGGNYIDIIGYHDYNSWWTLPLHIDSVLSIRNHFGYQAKPVWLTESSVSSTYTPITPLYTSVDEQAADVWRRSCLAWSKGVDLYFWHSMWSSGPPSEWQEFGLADHLGTKKKSFHSYNLLAGKLLNFSSAELISHGVINDDNTSGGNGVWVVKFTVDGQNRWVMWSPDNQSHTLTASSNTEYFIHEVVPYFVSANGQAALFARDSVMVMAGGSHTFSLGTLPVLVEEQNITGINGLENVVSHTVFPNPADDHLVVRVNRSPGEGQRLRVYDIAGRLMYSSKSSTAVNSTIITDQWPDGIYFYEILLDGYRNHGKFVVRH